MTCIIQSRKIVSVVLRSSIVGITKWVKQISVEIQAFLVKQWRDTTLIHYTSIVSAKICLPVVMCVGMSQTSCHYQEPNARLCLHGWIISKWNEQLTYIMLATTGKCVLDHVWSMDLTQLQTLCSSLMAAIGMDMIVQSNPTWDLNH